MVQTYGVAVHGAGWVAAEHVRMGVCGGCAGAGGGDFEPA